MRVVPERLLALTVSQLEAFTVADKVYSGVEQVLGNSEPPSDPKAAAALDLVIVQAEFGVAENGALRLGEDCVTQRSALYLTQHLAVIVSRRELVATVHDAFAPFILASRLALLLVRAIENH